MSQKPDDPFAQGDVTILRPRVRRRAGLTRAGDASPERAQAPLPNEQVRGSVPQSPPNYASSAAAAAAHADLPTNSTNPLLHAAVPLLVLAAELRARSANADVEGVRQHAVQGIRNFEDQLRRALVPAEDVLAARYALCTVIDEAVLNTPWGARSSWAGQSLLVTFHRESAGGEKFFQILDRVLREAQRYVALLEVLHACLALGFEGRYRLEERGPAKLAEVRQNLYRVIQSVRGSSETDLSPHWKGVEDRRNAVVRFVPLWVVAAACSVVLIGSFILFSAWLSERTEGINAALANVGLEPLYAAVPAQTAPRVSFRTLLASQIAQGLVGVDERDDGRTFITLIAPDLFASASETLNTRYRALIEAVGTAAQQVPGRLTVVGHTDDQPLRSLRFGDNYQLSRARALEVANLLRGKLREPDRVDFVGKGDSEPRYRPESLPDNRARNRRVEIIHRREG